MRLTKQTTCAVRMLVYCHQNQQRLIKVQEIADALDLTKLMALKLASILGQAGFLETVRGPSGGVKLTETAQGASIGAIVRALEVLPADAQSEPSDPILADVLEEAFTGFLTVLDGQMLSDLAKRNARLNKMRRRPRKAAARSSRSTHKDLTDIC